MNGWETLRINVSRLATTGHSITRQAQLDSWIDIDTTVEAPLLETSTAKIAEGTSVTVAGRVDATHPGLDLRLTLASTWTAECRRCLEDVESAFTSDFRGLFVLGEEAAQELAAAMLDDDVDVYTYDGEFLELAERVREELLLSLPLSPLCGPDCQGPDPDNFDPVASPQRSDDQGDSSIDPRWAALSGLVFEEDDED